MKPFSIRASVAAVALALLQACGGGGGGSKSDTDNGSTASSPEGTWSGTAVSRGSNYDVTLVVLEDGHYYGVYASGGVAQGLLEGDGSTSSSTFSSSNGRDFPFGNQEYAPFTLSANFTTKQSISGSAQYSGFNATFNGSYDASYDTPASLTDIAGTYSGSAGSLEGASDVVLSIMASGSFTGITSTGCRVSGSLSPRSGGKAVFNLAVTYDSATCGTGITVRGVAGKSGSRGLVFAATNSDRSDALYGFVTQP